MHFKLQEFVNFKFTPRGADSASLDNELLLSKKHQQLLTGVEITIHSFQQLIKIINRGKVEPNLKYFLRNEMDRP
jgi:hypothetical protein